MTMPLLKGKAARASSISFLGGEMNCGSVAEVAPFIKPFEQLLAPARTAKDVGVHRPTRSDQVWHAILVHDLISFDSAFAMIDSEPIDALLTLVDPFTLQHRKRIVDFAAQRRLPAIYEAGEFVETGGLISYGPNLPIIEQRAAEYVDKIFKGTKPADLPVEQPTKFEMLINMKTATALRLASRGTFIQEPTLSASAEAGSGEAMPLAAAPAAALPVKNRRRSTSPFPATSPRLNECGVW
jgi:hypothetical protein